MPYIKFMTGDPRHYRCTIMPFKTQHGIEAIALNTAEEIPVNESGFKYFNDKNQLLGDYYAYRYHYDGNSYSVERDVINRGGGSDAPLPASPILQLQNMVYMANQRISNVDANLSQEIQAITPYIETKTAYIDDTEIIFESDAQGNVLASAVNTENESVECLVNRDGKVITVSFLHPLEYVTNVTISIS